MAAALGKSFSPEVVKFVPELPRTRSAKILRRAIRAAVVGEDAGDLSSLENPAALEEIRRGAIADHEAWNSSRRLGPHFTSARLTDTLGRGHFSTHPRPEAADVPGQRRSGRAEAIRQQSQAIQHGIARAIGARCNSQLQGLSQSWRDREHEKFSEEFQQTMQVLSRFIEVADEHVPFLIRKADRAEEYLRQR